MKKTAKNGYEFLIQVFPNWPEKEPRLEYRVNEYELLENMTHFTDRKTNTSKAFPTTICYIDEVKA